MNHNYKKGIMNKRLIVLLAFGLFVGVFVFNGHNNTVWADETPMSPYSWDSGLLATTSRYNDQSHAWGVRKSGGAWGTGPVNYQSGATNSNLASSSGTLRVVLEGTYCPGGVCSYGSGSGYKGLVQFWNDPSNFIAFGLIHDPGVSPNGMTIMIEGSANGRPVGGYWPAGAVSGTSHLFTFTWSAGGISVNVDNQVVLGPYPVTENHPSVSFLAAGRNTNDIADTTFTNISFTSGSVVAQPVTIPSGSPYATFSATLQEGGTGTGYSAYVNSHDASNNAISLGIQTDSGSPESQGQPYFIWERVQNGQFTYDYLGPASNGNQPVTLKWWKGDDTVVFYEGSTAVADISVHLNPRLFFSVEGNARKNGDSVNDTITNTQISAGDTCPTYCGLNGSWNTSSFNFYGLHATNTNGQTQNSANFTITGTVGGLPTSGTWDTNEVAGIAMIAQYWNGQ
jgi:hypothetical protein